MGLLPVTIFLQSAHLLTFRNGILKSKKDILSDFLSFTPSIPLKIFLVSPAILGTRFPPLCAQLIAQYTQSHTASSSYVSRHTTASISYLYESYRKDTTNTKTSIDIHFHLFCAQLIAQYMQSHTASISYVSRRAYIFIFPYISFSMSFCLK